MTQEELRRRRRERLLELRRRRRRRGLAVLAGIGLLIVILTAASPFGGDSPIDRVAAKAKRSEPSKTPAERRRERVRKQRERAKRAVDRVRSFTSYVAAGRPVEPVVALTFDDGPGAATDEVLEILDRHRAKATFFVLGNMLSERPKLVRKALRHGHAVGGHSFDHPRMGMLSGADQELQLENQFREFAEEGLPAPILFRPPHGSINAETLELLDRHDQLMVLWSVDTGDYLNPGAEVIAERALSGAKPGAIILMHDGGADRSQTVAALPRILEGLKQRGLKPVTVPQLLETNPPSRKQPPPQSLDVSTG